MKFSTIIIAIFLMFSCNLATAVERRPDPHRDQLVQSSDIQKINDVYVVHFIIDGTSRTVFEDAVKAGKLPNLQRLVMDRGASFNNAVSVFPSASTTAYQAFVTGLLPGHSGIPHLERFDRDTGNVIEYLTPDGPTWLNGDLFNSMALINPDNLVINPPTTIFELLKGHKTAALYTPFSRGASFVFPKKAPVAAMWHTFVTGNIEKVDVLAYDKLMGLYNDKDIPRYTIAGLYSADILGHKYGATAKEIETALIQFDVFLRDFAELLKQRGIFDKTYLIVSTDHGMHNGSELFDLGRELENQGLEIKTRNPKDNKFDLYLANRGVSSAQIYLRHDGKFRPVGNPEIFRKFNARNGNSYDLVKIITSLPQTDLFIARNGLWGADVYNGEGKHAHIECAYVSSIDYCSYSYDASLGDPLHYSRIPEAAKLSNGQPHSIQTWLAATANSEYPDGVAGIGTLFFDGRAGDALVLLKPQWGFRKSKLGNHGGLIRDDMNIFLALAGPGVPQRRFLAARATDILPLAIDWFGLSNLIQNYDGRDPFNQNFGDGQSQKISALKILFRKNPPILKMIDVEDFVRNKVYKIVPPKEFDGLLSMARRDLARLSAASKNLSEILHKLDKQEKSKDAPAVTDPKYIDDHRLLVEDIERGINNEFFVMQDVVLILESCKNIGAESCRRL